MAVEKIINVVVNESGFGDVENKVNSLNDSLGKVDGSSKSVSKSMANSANAVLENGGAMGLLNDATGGYAMMVKDAVEASGLFNASLGKLGTAWQGMGRMAKIAIASTGIGALVVAVGLLIAYFDDIKAIISGIDVAQTKLNESTKKNLEMSEKKLETLSSQDNILKLQGKSEEEIFKIKQKQTQETIKALEAQIVQQEATKKAQVEAAKRNKDILEGILKFISVPITLLLKSIDAVGKALGKDFGLENKIFGGISKLIFDPEEVASEGDKAIEESKKKLLKLKNEEAGFQLSINQIRDEKNKERLAKEKEAADKLAEQRRKQNEAYLALLKKLKTDVENLEDDTEQEKLDRAKARELAEINALEGKNEKEKQVLRNLLNDKYKILQDALNKENELKEEQRQKDIQALIQANEIEKSIADAKTIAQLEEIYIKAQEQLDAKQETDILELERLGATEAQIAELKEAQRVQDLALETQYTDAKLKLAEIENQAMQQKVTAYSNSFKNISKLVGENTALGKAAAVAGATIDTYQSAVSSYKGMVSAIPGPVGIAAGAVAAAASVASGLMTVKKILSVKTPGSGGGAGGGGVAAPPPPPQFNIVGQNSNNQLAQTIGQQQNKPVNAYVVGNEVTTQQAADRNRIVNATFS